MLKRGVFSLVLMHCDICYHCLRCLVAIISRSVVVLGYRQILSVSLTSCLVVGLLPLGFPNSRSVALFLFMLVIT